jgi:hypothetical protein
MQATAQTKRGNTPANTRPSRNPGTTWKRRRTKSRKRETTKESVPAAATLHLIPLHQDFLKCRTVGICMVHNRLLGNRVVRSTRPVQFIPTGFLPKDEFRSRRDEGHLQRCPSYPDPDFFLNFYQKFLFRHASLRGLRVEQVNRHCTGKG